MASRILIINNENNQELPLTVMDRFQQVVLVVGKNQNNMPVELVSQLLLAQAQHNVHIELMTLKGANKAAIDLQFALQLGRMVERNQDSQFTILSSDTSFDPLIIGCKEQGLKINRVEALQRLSTVQNSAPEEKTAPTPISEETEDETELSLQTKEPEAETASSRNHRLISSLIGGTR